MGVSGPRPVTMQEFAVPDEGEATAKASLMTALPPSPTPVAAAAAKGSLLCPKSLCWNNGGDHAAGSKRHISLSDPGPLPKVCACIPGMLLFPPMLAIILAAFFSQEAMVWIAAAFTIWSVIYSVNLSVGCTFGFFRMRRDVQIDWHAKLEKQQAESPEDSKVMHIVFLPNYKEDEQMMKRTLDNLARSAMARDSMYVVLAMEDREGEVAHQKAKNLIESSSHLFADLSATFHPANLPGDTPGKSSNCQWAYRQVLQRLAPELSKHDASQVFLTCCDADTLFHPQYFSAMAYQGLTMSRKERIWSLWQPPILLLRNLYSSPSPTRVSGYATIIFELAGLTNQKLSPHFSFSTYSFTLAMASHRFVDGWDRDVIAEDHHMFCKCYFASVWEQLEQTASTGEQPSGAGAESQMKLNPVYLPAISFLVESDDGWLASTYARFVQARRHSQGLSELSYVCLQHAHLLMADANKMMSKASHLKILNIAGKMATVHLIPTMHGLSFMVTALLVIFETLRWMFSMDPQELITLVSTRGIEGVWSMQSFAGLKWGLFAVFGSVPPLGLLMSAVTYMVVRDTMEGKLSSDPAASKKVGPAELAAPDVQGSVVGSGGMSWLQQVKLYLMIQSDYVFGAVLTMFVYGVFPESMAAWSLLSKNGNGFQYIVGIKPTDVAA